MAFAKMEVPLSARFSIGGRGLRWEEWRDVLVATKGIVRIVALLQRLQALEGFIAEGGTHALDGLVGLHVVHVAAADRPRLEGRRGGARPLDGWLVEGGVQPGGHHADVE